MVIRGVESRVICPYMVIRGVESRVICPYMVIRGVEYELALPFHSKPFRGAHNEAGRGYVELFVQPESVRER